MRQGQQKLTEQTKGGAGVKRTKTIFVLLKKNFSSDQLTSECAEAVKEGFKAFKRFYISRIRG